MGGNRVQGTKDVRACNLYLGIGTGHERLDMVVMSAASVAKCIMMGAMALGIWSSSGVQKFYIVLALCLFTAATYGKVYNLVHELLR